MSEEEDFFQELIRAAMPGRVISNFVLVCEVLTEDGAELSISTSESLTPWLGIGMLQSAQNMLQDPQNALFLGIFDEIEDEE